MVLVDGNGLPLGVHISPASRAESKLAEEALAHVPVPRSGPGRPKQKPERIAADRGYDNKIEHYRAFLYVACKLIALRQFFETTSRPSAGQVMIEPFR